MEHFDHVIVGGGVIGSAVAYHLAGENCGSVLLVERQELACAASSLAAGLLLQVSTKPAKTPLARLTRQTLAALESEGGKSEEGDGEETVGFHAVGSLRLAASQARVEELEAMAADAAHHGIAFDWLSAADAAELVPWLDLSRVQKIAYLPSDGYIDPYLLSTAYARAAAARGATIRLRTAVTDVAVAAGHVTGLSTSAGPIACDNVIDAAGAWAAVFSARAGYPLPMAPVRSHYWITEPEVAFGGDHPVVLVPDASAYMRPEVGGLVLGIQEANSATFDARDLPDDPRAFSPTLGTEGWDLLTDAAASVGRIFPGIMAARFAHYVCGLSSYTPDGQIILGPVPGLTGFFAAAGCCGSGVTLSAGIGAAITDLVLGRDPAFDISPFRPERFGPVDPFSAEFRQRCAAARASKSRRAG